MKIVFNVSLFFIATMYISIPADYMTKVWPTGPIKEWMWTLIFACIYVPLAWMNDLSIVSKIAVGGVICVLFAICVIVTGAIRYWVWDGRVDKDSIPGSPYQLTGHVPFISSPDFPLMTEAHKQEENDVVKFIGSFSTWAFGFGAILITPSTRLQMKNPQEVKKAVVNSHLLVSIVYVIMILPVLYGFADASVWSGNIVILMNNPIQAPVTNDKTGGFVGYGEFKNLADPNTAAGKLTADDFPGPVVIQPSATGASDAIQNPFPTKSWEGWVITICTIISVSITFPLIVRILTRMGEQSFQVLNKNKAIQLIWRTLMVCTCIGCGLILGSMDKFNPALGMVASIFMVPIQFMMPIIMYFAMEAQCADGFGGGVKSVGIIQVTAMAVILLVSLMFMGFGAYGSGKAFGSQNE